MAAYGDLTGTTPFLVVSCRKRDHPFEGLMGYVKKVLRRSSLHNSIDYSYSSSEAEAEADPNRSPKILNETRCESKKLGEEFCQ